MKSQPQADRGEFHHHRIVGGKLIIARDNAAEVLVILLKVSEQQTGDAFGLT
jgi:hypothetical protein